MTGLFATEASEWNAWAIVALLITNAGSLYALIKKERRTDHTQDADREDNLSAQWRAYAKSMEVARNKAEAKKAEAEDRERKFIAEVSRLTECVRQKDERIEELERDQSDAN